MSLEHLKTISHKTLAAFMAVWLSGVVFLLCCEQMNGKATEAEFCPLAKKSAHCDKAERVNADSSFAESTSETAIDCCGFLPAVFDKVRKLEQTQKLVAVTPKLAAAGFRVPQLTNSSPSTPTVRASVRKRGRTLVQNCVFRI